jgi:hypothetical protein
MIRVECIQSKKACYEAVMKSEAQPKRRGSSDAECIQSVPSPKPAFVKKQERERPAYHSAKETRERDRHNER